MKFISHAGVSRSPIHWMGAGWIAFTLALTTPPASADMQLLLDVGGTIDAGQTVDGGEAVAVSFTVEQTFTDVAVAAPIHCFGCEGSWTLMRNRIGPGASFGDVLAADYFDGSTQMPLVTSILLSPDDYFLVLAIDTGFAIWPGSLAPMVTSATGVLRRLDFKAASTEPFPPQSDFDVVFDEGAMHFTVYQTGVVPTATASWGLVKALFDDAPGSRRTR